jgi:uncharacterized SAM-binding protein YcdF (DUF218 family)
MIYRNIKNWYIDISLFFDDANRLGEFLAYRNIAGWSELRDPVDLIVLLGNSTLHAALVAAEGLRAGKAERIVIAGGIGHSTEWLYRSIASDPEFRGIPTGRRSEASVLSDVLEMCGVIRSSMLLEENSTNCGANAVEVRKLLERSAIRPQRMVLIQDPTMQRRTDASFRHAWDGTDAPEFINFAPFVPHLSLEGLGPQVRGLWPTDRYLSLILGEIPRLRDGPGGYGPRGSNYIAHVEIPVEVESAWARMRDALSEFATR